LGFTLQKRFDEEIRLTFKFEKFGKYALIDSFINSTQGPLL